jgi:hypothetical protein
LRPNFGTMPTLPFAKSALTQLLSATESDCPLANRASKTCLNFSPA